VSVRVEVKWVDDAWRSFGTETDHRSAGIADMVERVEAELQPSVGVGEHIVWRVSGNKFVVQIVDKPAGKLSKSDQVSA
jgi:hypothetical protein